jgi:hypothetical protein
MTPKNSPNALVCVMLMLFSPSCSRYPLIGNSKLHCTPWMPCRAIALPPPNSGVVNTPPLLAPPPFTCTLIQNPNANPSEFSTFTITDHKFRTVLHYTHDSSVCFKDLYLQSGHLSSCKGDAQRVGAVCHDAVQAEPDLTRRWHVAIAYLPAKPKKMQLVL